MTTRGNTSIEEMNIVELFTRANMAKCLQQAAAAKVGEDIEVITIDKSDSELEHEMCDSNSRSGDRGGPVPSSSCGQDDGDCNESSCKEFDEGDDEDQDHGEDLVSRYR